MKKFKIFTLGCKTNQYESQAYADQLIALGFSEAKNSEEADLCIVNTCSVTSQAEASSRNSIRLLLKNHPQARFIVTGCMAETDLTGIKKISENLEIFSNLTKESLISFLFPEEKKVLPFSIKNFEGHTRAFVKIQDGCNQFCSYCTVPLARGRSRSRDVFEILDEVKTLVSQGYNEIVLTGINIGDFYSKLSLSELLQTLDSLEGLERIRLSSLDPSALDSTLLQTILSGKKIAPHLHLSLQSGSDTILKKMYRRYVSSDFLNITKHLLEKNPKFTFTSDLIVGFPGETEKEFQETCEFIKQIPFIKIHLFPYSKRKNTQASLLADQIPCGEIKKRMQILLELSKKITYQTQEKFLQKTLSVLVEKKCKVKPSELWTGHTENFLTVFFPPKGTVKDFQKKIFPILLTKNSEQGLIGELL